MAETQIQTPQKRLREEKSQDDSSSEPGGSSGGSKRQKPCNSILDLLDDKEEEVIEPSHELSQDLSALFTTLEQELSSSPGSPPYTASSEAKVAELAVADRHVTSAGDDDEGLKLSVMRHLLEASDDELGIPNRSTDEINSGMLKSGESFSLAFNDHEHDDGLWEFEDDEAANYYAVLQSQLFM